MFHVRCFLVLVLAFFSVQSYEYNYNSTDNRDANTGFFLALGGTYSNPVRLSEKNYSGDQGYQAKIGLNINVLNGFIGSAFFFGTENNKLKLKNTSVLANVQEMYFGWEMVLFAVKYGMSIGGLKFAMPDQTFNSLGGTTLTELAHENKKIQMCQSIWVGAKIPIPVENNLLNRFSVDYDYRMISADRAWMFWHDMLSSVIMGACLDLSGELINKLGGKGSIGTTTILALARLGIGAMYWYNDYQYHNWPWKDESPFRIHRHAVSVTFQFKRLNAD
jgi:hypothetical protein